MAEPGLGRRVPSDWVHVERYPWTATTTMQLNVDLPLDPKYLIDQGSAGSCVGASLSHLSSIDNHYRFDWVWLWHQARLADEWPDNDDLSDDDQGTSVRAGCDILRQIGHSRRTARGQTYKPSINHGIIENRWATTVDQMRQGIGESRFPVVVGINWYSSFDERNLEQRTDSSGQTSWWVKDCSGGIRGGHAICVPEVKDPWQAFGWTNSWGPYYPRKVYVPYAVMERLLREDGESCLITDRPER